MMELEVLRLGHVPEGPFDVALQVVQTELARVDHHRAGLDLRQVEDVVDEHEQVVAGRVDRLGELRLLDRQVAFGVLAELVGEDQQAVERRPQFVRHVGQEFRLVLGGEGQLLGLLFQFLAGLLDFLVLAFHFLVLLGEQPGLFLQFLVGVLQFFLPRLQLLGQRLRLFEQVFGAHVGFDGVEHDADRLGELLEEGLVRAVEALERGQLEHAADLTFEDQRQHEHAARRRFAQAGRDANVVGRQVVEQDLRFSRAHWPTSP